MERIVKVLVVVLMATMASPAFAFGDSFGYQCALQKSSTLTQSSRDSCTEYALSKTGTIWGWGLYKTPGEPVYG
jgi:hypothetical protein